MCRLSYMYMKKQNVIIISGATATGKSDFAIQMGREVSGEIINADIGSFYKPLTIGTAKPDWKGEAVPHHLFDIIEEPYDYTVAQYRQDVQRLCLDIWNRNNTPIIVGGSAFYIKALLYKHCAVTVNKEYVAELERSPLSNQELWNELASIDGLRASQIQPNDRYRVIRALAIFEGEKKLPSQFAETFSPIAPFHFIEYSRDREESYHRIDKRVIQMIDDGLLEEVVSLQGTKWEEFLLRKKIIGYDDLLRALQKETFALDEVIPVLQQRTRNYAKRQVTFLKKLKGQLREDLIKNSYKDCIVDHVIIK